MDDRPSKAQRRERWSFSLIPIISACVLVFILRGKITDELAQKVDSVGVYQTMLSLWGTLLGFIFATAAILVSVNDTEFIKRLRASGNYKSVLLAYISSCVHIFVALIITTFLFVLDIWSRGWMMFILGASTDVFITIALTIFFFAVMIVREK